MSLRRHRLASPTCDLLSNRTMETRAEDVRPEKGRLHRDGGGSAGGGLQVVLGWRRLGRPAAACRGCDYLQHRHGGGWGGRRRPAGWVGCGYRRYRDGGGCGRPRV